MTMDIHLVSQGGLNLYSYKMGMDNDIYDCDDDLLSYLVYSIRKAIQVISKTGKNVESIDLGEIKVHFKYGEKMWEFLISDEGDMQLHVKLKSLIHQFEEKYRDTLACWDGNRTRFQDAKELIREIFIQEQLGR